MVVTTYFHKLVARLLLPCDKVVAWLLQPWHFYMGALAQARPTMLYILLVRYYSSFQLAHIPRGNHVQSITSSGDEWEDKKLLQRSHIFSSTVGEFWHVSVGE